MKSLSISQWKFIFHRHCWSWIYQAAKEIRKLLQCSITIELLSSAASGNRCFHNPAENLRLVFHHVMEVHSEKFLFRDLAEFLPQTFQLPFHQFPDHLFSFLCHRLISCKVAWYQGFKRTPWSLEVTTGEIHLIKLSLKMWFLLKPLCSSFKKMDYYLLKPTAEKCSPLMIGF